MSECCQCPKLLIKNLDKSFPVPEKSEPLAVLENITFTVNEGEIIGILGPSGCGKSTLLNIVAGFEFPSYGEIFCCGKPILGPSPERAMVFQSAVLFPWLTVKENIAYGLKRKRLDPQTLIDQVRQYIQLVGLTGFENYYPEQLSGGMQQRVSLARVLTMHPHVLLMDEPFASLDAQTRFNMQKLLLSLWQNLRPTILFVTHDIEEALLLCDVIYIMSKRPGRIIHRIKVPFQKPHSPMLSSSMELLSMKNQIIELLAAEANSDTLRISS